MQDQDKLKLIIRARVNRMLNDYEGDDPAQLLGYIKDEVERLTLKYNAENK